MSFDSSSTRVCAYVDDADVRVGKLLDGLIEFLVVFDTAVVVFDSQIWVPVAILR